jgi:bifunctional UDP-N-acetylglucosamine pyrophosphorylase/glucosamine-1-phosphate N-acetyltransferase
LNAGVYCFQADWLWSNLPNIKVSPKGEYYLTDLVEIAVQQGHSINALVSHNLQETMGINTLEHLAEAEAALGKD